MSIGKVCALICVMVGISRSNADSYRDMVLNDKRAEIENCLLPDDLAELSKDEIVEKCIELSLELEQTVRTLQMCRESRDCAQIRCKIFEDMIARIRNNYKTNVCDIMSSNMWNQLIERDVFSAKKKKYVELRNKEFETLQEIEKHLEVLRKKWLSEKDSDERKKIENKIAMCILDKSNIIGEKWYFVVDDDEMRKQIHSILKSGNNDRIEKNDPKKTGAEFDCRESILMNNLTVAQRKLIEVTAHNEERHKIIETLGSQIKMAKISSRGAKFYDSEYRALIKKYGDYGKLFDGIESDIEWIEILTDEDDKEANWSLIREIKKSIADRKNALTKEEIELYNAFRLDNEVLKKRIDMKDREISAAERRRKDIQYAVEAVKRETPEALNRLREKLSEARQALHYFEEKFGASLGQSPIPNLAIKECGVGGYQELTPVNGFGFFEKMHYSYAPDTNANYRLHEVSFVKHIEPKNRLAVFEEEKRVPDQRRKIRLAKPLTIGKDPDVDTAIKLLEALSGQKYEGGWVGIKEILYANLHADSRSGTLCLCVGISDVALNHLDEILGEKTRP